MSLGTYNVNSDYINKKTVGSKFGVYILDTRVPVI